MKDEDQSKLDPAEEARNILSAAMAVITGPAEFFRGMSRTGGFLRPLLFMIVLGLASGLVLSVLALIGLSPAGAVVTGLSALIVMPIMVGIFGFVAAALLFVIWKIMGSQQSYETAYRSMAYTAAIMPLTSLLEVVPYLGGIAGLVWTTFLLVTASIEVHAIKARTAWTGFGAICAIFVLASVSAEIAGRKMARHMQSWETENSRNLDRLQEMTPEEAGRALGDFFKGMQEAAGDK